MAAGKLGEGVPWCAGAHTKKIQDARGGAAADWAVPTIARRPRRAPRPPLLAGTFRPLHC